MVKRILMPLLAAVIVVAMVIPGCGEPTPTDFNFTMAVDPAGSGTTVPAPGTTKQAPDAVIDITAEPAEGYFFTGWTTTRGEFQQPVTQRINRFTMPASDVTVTANFAEIPEGFYVVDMAVSPEGTGTAVAVAGLEFYEQGTSVEIFAEPVFGYDFDEWTSDPAGVSFDDSGDPSTSFTMPDNEVTIIANFAYQVAPAGWQPVDIRMAIRNNLPPYPDAGDWLADRFEEVHSEAFRTGFKVTRIYGDAGGLWPYWGGVHPSQGRSHIYTGGWGSPTIPRDSGGIFDQMYTHRVMTWGPWVVYAGLLQDGDPASANAPADPTRWWSLDEASRRLRYKEFSTMAEREGFFRVALEKGLEFSPRIWTVDTAGYSPFKKELRVVGNVAGGISDPNWVHTVHWHNNLQPIAPDGSGSTDVHFEMPGLFVEAWNPVEGSSWTYDLFVMRRALGDSGVMADPGPGATGGLYWPHRIESAEVWTEQNLPIGSLLDGEAWFTHNEVAAADAALAPDPTAWADWDATTRQWITVAQKDAADSDWDGTKALTRTRIVYPADLWDVPLHDGSTISPADFLMAMIISFDRGKVASPIFDPLEKDPLEIFLNSFKGVKIVSLQPLIIDTWSDVWFMDAEWHATRHWFPQYGTYGCTGFWHKVAIGWYAEANNTGSTGGMTAAFSGDKSDTEDVWWMDYTKGDPADFPGKLLNELNWAAASTDRMPYKAAIADVYTTLGWTGDPLNQEIAARYSNLQDFYALTGHFWAGNGPYWIANVAADVKPVVKELRLTRFADYPDDGDIFFYFFDPAPVNVPANKGAWVDSVTITMETNHADAVAKIIGCQIDLFAFPVTDALLIAQIEADLSFFVNFGSYREITYNPYRDPDTFAPYFDGEFTDLNPFAVPQIREATNYMLNRPLWVAEYLGGAGAPKWTALGTAFPDHALYYDDIVEPIEEKYAFNMAKASEIIYDEMMFIGARLYFDPALGRIVWHYQP